MQVEEISQPTNTSGFDMMAPQIPSNVQGTTEEAQKVSFIKKRFYAMNYKRIILDKSWDIYERQWEAPFIQYPDGRASSNIPLERSIIELAVAELRKRKSDFNFKGSKGSEFQANVMKYVWKDIWAKQHLEEQIVDNEYITAKLGTSALFTGFEIDKRIINDLDESGDDEEMKFTRKMETTANIVMKNFDLRRLWIDEQATSMRDAVDCIATQYISYANFYSFKLNTSAGYKNLDTVIGSRNFFDFYLPYVSKEERGNFMTNYVKLTHYYNKVNDAYIVVANDEIVIRDTHILNAKHELPFTMRQFFRNTNSIYGTGMCEILLPFKSEINKIREMIIEAVRRSNNQVIAIGGNLAFDGQQFAYNNQILQFKGNLPGNFQQLSGTPPNQAIFNLLNQLYEDVAIFSGVDLRNLLGTPQQTAYQTAVQKESSLQRINNVITNRDEAYQRMADQHLDNVMMYYPRKMASATVEIDEHNEPTETPETNYPTVEVEGKKISGKKVVNTEGKSLFEITPEVIRGDVGVEVYTNLNTPTINEVEKQQLMDFYSQGVIGIANAYQAAPELESMKPKKEAISDLADKFNIDMLEGTEEATKEAKAQLFADLTHMANGLTNPVANVMGGNQTTNAGQQQPQPNAATPISKLPGLRQPGVPLPANPFQ